MQVLKKKKLAGIWVNQELIYDPGTVVDAPCPRLTDQKAPEEPECEGTECEGTEPKAQ